MTKKSNDYGEINESNGLKKSELPEEITSLVSAWYKYFHRWWLVHYFLGICGTIASISVASNANFLQAIPFFLDISAWIAAVCMALITFLLPSKRAKAYKMAWNVLFSAANRYAYGSIKSLDEVFEAVKKGEDYIERIDL